MAAVPLTLYLARRDGPVETADDQKRETEQRAAVEAAYQRGLREGRESANAACDAVITEKEQDLAQFIEEARRNWASLESAVLAQRIEDAVAAAKAEIAETAARILKPLVENALAEEALSKLVTEIGKLLSDGDAIKLKISGPADLIEKVNARLGQTLAATADAGDAPEVKVFANRTVIEARLTQWLDCTGVDSHAPEEERRRRSAPSDIHHP